jgi:D-alanine-D-alanine ligase-like ATP-grasp enzyme
MVPTNNLGMSLPEFTTLMPPGPLFLKPVTEGSSKGIGSFNKVSDVAEFKMAVRKLAAKFPGQDILVESFLSGREVTVSILGTGTSGRVIGVREHLWQAKNRNGYASKLDFASREAKSCGPEVVAYTDTPDMTDPQIKAACQVALDAWNVLGCRDAGRVDIRFDSGGPDSVPNVLEVGNIKLF